MDQLQVTATFPSIHPDDLASFKKTAREALAIVEKEQGTLQYDWFFNDDETKCVLRETYTDSDAVLAHIGAMGEQLGGLIDLGGGIEVEVFGNPSETLRQAAAEMKPAVYSYFQGK